MPQYRVTMTGESREVYIVEADSADDARDNWQSGFLIVQESSGMDLDSVELDEDD